MRINHLLVLFALPMLLGASLMLPTTHSDSTWSIQTVDDNVDGGSHVGMAFDSHHNLHLAYDVYEEGNYRNPRDLKYASWKGTGWYIETLTQGTSMDFALDKNDNPHILYYDSGVKRGLKYASFNGTSWNLQVVDSQGRYGSGSLALDSEGNAHVAYIASGTPLKVNYASWTGSAWNTQTIGSSGDFESVALALDSNSNPHILYETGEMPLTVYSGLPFRSVEYATWNAITNSWVTSTVLQGNVDLQEMALDSADNLRFLYRNESLNIGNSTMWTTLMYWNNSIYDSLPVANLKSSIFESGGRFTLDANGYPHIDYFNTANISNVLTYATWTGSTWNNQTIDIHNPGAAGTIVLDSNGNPYVAYLGPSTIWNPTSLMLANFTEPTPTPTPTASATDAPTLPVVALLITVPIVAFAVTLSILYIRKKGNNEKKDAVSNA